MKRVPSISASQPCHVVLGGSRGIGFAFASWLAANKEPLLIISRHPGPLRTAILKLERAGAPRAECMSGDLLDCNFRSDLMFRMRGRRIRSVFIGGPSPASGRIEDLSPQSFESAYQSCVAYPIDIVHGFTTTDSYQPLSFIFLSSSAAREAITGHPFYLSAVFRRTAERILQDISLKMPAIRLLILRPRVVWTDLAEQYARKVYSPTDPDSGRAKLAERFHVKSVPDPDAYILNQSRRLQRVLYPSSEGRL
jgi:hypothetical protein